MGLSISREIVQKYNGKITFTSEYLQGSNFAFTFDLENYGTQLFDSNGNFTLGKNIKDVQRQILANEITNNIEYNTKEISEFTPINGFTQENE